MSVPGNLYTPTIRKTRGGDYLIEQSLRFNDDDSAYLTRTPGSAGNRKTWTYSCWLKPSTSGTYESFLYAGVDTGNRTRIFINSDSKLYIMNNTASVLTVLLYTDALFRDPSAWYHIVIACDTTQATDTDKIRLWVNGVQVDLLSGTPNYPSLNEDLHINNSVVQNIGYDSSYYFDGLMALPILVDGTALDPTSFGEEDAEGYWNPIEFAGASSTTQFTTDIGTLAQHIDNAAASGEANLYDGDGDAFSDPAWSSGVNPDTNDAWLGQDFGSGVTKTIRQVTIYQNNSSGGTNYVADWDLQYSDNGSSWTLAESYTGLSGTALSEDLIHDGSAGAHRYWRLIARSDAASGSGTVIREIEWYEVEDTTSATNGYGTNGFVLDFSDTSNFGDDTSGNGNDYTSNNFTAADQLSDTPTDSTDNETGNFASFSPIYTRGATNYLSRISFSENNTKVTFSNNAGAVIPFNLAGFASQIEFTFSGSSTDDKVGFIDDATYGGDLASIIVNPESGKWYFENGGNKSVNGAAETSYGSSWTTNRITVYVTASGYVYYAIDGTLQNSASIANIEADAGTNAAFQITSDTFFAFAGGRNTSSIITVNTGQTAFTDTTPSGHGDVATQNLPEASITTPFTDGFTGNANAEGPFVYTGAAPDVDGTSTINGNTVTWGTHAIPLANGFKLITSSTSYNASGANTCSIDLLTESEGGAFQGGSNVSTQGRARYA